VGEKQVRLQHCEDVKFEKGQAQSIDNLEKKTKKGQRVRETFVSKERIAEPWEEKEGGMSSSIGGRGVKKRISSKKGPGLETKPLWGLPTCRWRQKSKGRKTDKNKTWRPRREHIILKKKNGAGETHEKVPDKRWGGKREQN